MSEAKKSVENFIAENFKVEEFQVTDFKLLPGGKVLTDKNGETILIFFDIQTEKVVYEFGEISKNLTNPRKAGRKKTVDVDQIHAFRNEGKTQEWIARELNVSISTIKRNWK
jgi:hypothetical protein